MQEVVTLSAAEEMIVKDVWGVQLNYKQAIQQVQQDNYSKAEKWLERVHQPVG